MMKLSNFTVTVDWSILTLEESPISLNVMVKLMLPISLGIVVHVTPVIVNVPVESLDILYVLPLITLTYCEDVCVTVLRLVGGLVETSMTA